jgi:VanZ family protein
MALITTAFCLGYPRYRLGILVVVIGGVGLLEVAQDIIPGRHGTRRDLAIKVAGALLGGTGAMIVERLKQKA